MSPGRCGADQFLIAMPGCTHEDTRSMAARLSDCVSERPFDILQSTVSMTASIGIAQSGGRSPLTVLREAESALSRAKLAGGACIRWFPSASTIALPMTRIIWSPTGASAPAATRVISGRKKCPCNEITGAATCSLKSDNFYPLQNPKCSLTKLLQPSSHWR